MIGNTMLVTVLIAAALQVCFAAPEGKAGVPCPLIMCPQCPEGFRTEKPWTEDADCSEISCKCVPAVKGPPMKPCPMINCPGGRFGECKKSEDGCDICECLPICPPVPPVCQRGCLKRFKSGCPYCYCPVAPPVCPLAACAMYCPHGRERDANGCNTCKCRKCPLGMCRMYCKYGFKKDKNGCEICQCNAKPICSEMMCAMYCEHGFVEDKNGCSVCKCRKCSRMMCRMRCKFGFQRDNDGCPVCKCRRMPIEIRPMAPGRPGSKG